MDVQPYLNFDGRCEEAIEFYKKAVGARVDMMMRYKENPEPSSAGPVAPGSDNKILHSAFRIGASTIMASDGYNHGESRFRGFSLTINVADEAEADRVFNALVAGGKVTLPLQKTFYSPRFGMLEDKFGMGWMVIVPGPQPK